MESLQPAEETGQGANKVLKSKIFRNLNSDFVFALHNIPGYPLHNIITMKEGFSAEVVSFSISLNGKKSHAAEPENGINPAIGLSELINALSKMNNPNPEDNNYAILTPIYINMGEKSYGISPANGELHYTIRSWSKEKMESLKSEIEDHIKRICQSKKIEFKLNWFEYFPASENDLEANTYVTNAAKENNYELLERPYPFKFGEDFGWFTKSYKTAMFGIGSGIHTPALIF